MITTNQPTTTTETTTASPGIWHNLTPSESARIQCIGCHEPATECLHLKWSTGARTGTSYIYYCAQCATARRAELARAHQPRPNVQYLPGERIRLFGGWYAHTRVIVDGLVLAGSIQSKRAHGRTTTITIYGDSCVVGWNWQWLHRMNLEHEPATTTNHEPATTETNGGTNHD